MVKVMIQVHVEYPDEFIGTFEAQARERHSAGETRYWDGGGEGKQNWVCVITDWPSKEVATKFWDSWTGEDHIAAWSSAHTEFTIVDGRMH